MSYLGRVLCKTRLSFPRINGPIMSLLKVGTEKGKFVIKGSNWRSFSFFIESFPGQRRPFTVGNGKNAFGRVLRRNTQTLGKYRVEKEWGWGDKV